MADNEWISEMKRALEEASPMRTGRLEAAAVLSDSPVMDDVTKYRLDQYEKRADAADARMGRVEDKLTDISVKLSALATRGTVWGAVATVIGGGLGLLGVIVAILTYLQAFPHPH
jgi:hypothetical protein